MNWVAIVVFVLLFALVTVVGFAATRGTDETVPADYHFEPTPPATPAKEPVLTSAA